MGKTFVGGVNSTLYVYFQIQKCAGKQKKRPGYFVLQRRDLRKSSNYRMGTICLGR